MSDLTALQPKIANCVRGVEKLVQIQSLENMNVQEAIRLNDKAEAAIKTFEDLRTWAIKLGIKVDDMKAPREKKAKLAHADPEG